MTAKAEIIKFLAAEFPQTKCTVEAVGGMAATIRREIGIHELRPGGTVSGPVLMMVADVALYVAIFGEIGIVPLAVTTNLTINFMRKPAKADLIATATMMKLGKALAVMDVAIRSDGDDRLVAHAVVTYSIPSKE